MQIEKPIRKKINSNMVKKLIPINIKREHIIKAIEDVRKFGTPKFRTSKKYFLKFDGDSYPPKYIISSANKYANGKELDPEKFSGGKETNDFLKSLGFNIGACPRYKKPVSKSLEKNACDRDSKKYHSERCPKCKNIVKKILEKIYGRVEQNYKFEIGTYPEDFKNTQHYNNLKEIYESLQNHRGFKKFIKAKTLPNSDFFIPNPGFIVEFDESQHFTLPRRIALEHYPTKLELGFDEKRWGTICIKINAKDNDPFYRDEQRAWYDTLRDFLPALAGLKPTVRLLARDFEWCSLDPDNPLDVKRFESFLKGELGEYEIEVREDSEPFLARIVVADEWKGNIGEARKLLENIYEKWPKGKKVRFITTCGGFIQFGWPKSISRADVGDNKYPNNKAMKTLVDEAEKCARLVLSNGLDGKLRELTDYITLGIDSNKEKVSTTKNFIGQLHTELVFLIDLRNNKFYWTGKSYPTSSQQNGLVRISDLKTHFFELDDVGKTMVLGCHDLSIFNPRSKTAKGWRKDINNKFKELAKKEKPNFVLHHPHTTVKTRTWLNAWNGLRKIIPSVEQYSGTGRYFESDRDKLEWDILDNVLEGTKCGNTIDFIVQKIK